MLTWPVGGAASATVHDCDCLVVAAAHYKVSGRTAVGQQFTSDDAADRRAGTCTRRGIPGSGAGQDA